MVERTRLVLLALAPLAVGSALAQNKVRTETIRPTAPAAPPAGTPFKADGHVASSQPGAADHSEIITDLTRLPAAVARMRERIVAAARTGDLDQLVAVMRSVEPMPVFSFSEDKDPAGFWKATYPDSDGVEALSILLTVLDAGLVHVDVGTPQELYLWPYFARMPLKALTPPQRVELFRIVTGADYKDMVEFGAYSFYRLGIAPDGTWQFFVSGD